MPQLSCPTLRPSLDEKQRELDEVQAKFEAAMKEKQVPVSNFDN